MGIMEITWSPFCDTVEKEVMNLLIEKGSLSMKEIDNIKDENVRFAFVRMLRDFEEEEYVKSEMVFDNPRVKKNGYLVWKTTDFFRFILSQQRDREAAREKLKQEVFREKQKMRANMEKDSSSTPTPP